MDSNPYIPWDVNLFYDSILKLKDVVGVAFNIGFWIFIVISGIYLMLKLVNSFSN